ncbi:MAG: hypothetical protein KAH24_04505 [Holophagae bacterium]|nr:hypothetical protein [Holophagae bacterium]
MLSYVSRERACPDVCFNSVNGPVLRAAVHGNDAGNMSVDTSWIRKQRFKRGINVLSGKGHLETPLKSAYRAWVAGEDDAQMLEGLKQRIAL